LTRIIEILSESLISLLILGGAVTSFISSIGLLRMPDFYTRSHAAGKATTLGVLLVLSGVFFHFWLAEGQADARLLLGIVFVFITAPVASHLIGRAAYRSGVRLWEGSVLDDLREGGGGHDTEEAKRDRQH
jgi:multicomponent Na+:H+ antiporter subunit G